MHALSLSATRTFFSQWSRRRALALRADRRLALGELARLEAHVGEIRCVLRSGGAFELSDALRGHAARFEAMASRFLREALPGRHDDRAGWRQLHQRAQDLNREYAQTRDELADGAAD